MLTKLKKSIRRHGLFSNGSRIVAAVSGGADSVAMLIALKELSVELSLRITVAHLNHSIRGKSADADARFVSKLAERLGLRVFVEKINVPRLAREEGISIEMAARRARYAFLLRTARSVDADAVATAHTTDDQAETILLKLFRGAGPSGLSGISRIAGIVVSPGGSPIVVPDMRERGGTKLVRPLIDVTRNEIVAFLRSRHEKWREDRTNADEAYGRNRIRRTMIPLIELHLNPKVKQALARVAEIMGEEDRWLDTIAMRLLAASCEKNGDIDAARLRKQPPAQRRRVLRLWLMGRGLETEDIGFDTIERIDFLCAEREGSGSVNLYGPWSIERRYDSIRLIRNKKAASSFCKTVAAPGATVLRGQALKITAAVETGIVKDRDSRIGMYPVKASLRWDGMDARKLRIRSWKEGDRIKPYGMNGTKKLQDIFVDAKVPLDLRKKIPVVEYGKDIIWLPGYRIARGWEIVDKAQPALQLKIESLS